MTTEGSTTTEVNPCSDGVIDLPGGTGGTSGSDTGETDTDGDNTGGEGVECDEGLDDNNKSKNTAKPYSKEQPKDGDSNCTPDCKVARYCGDGKHDKDEGEECDDGNDDGDDGCRNCFRDRRVFVTSERYCGNMNEDNSGACDGTPNVVMGKDSAMRGDARCQALAMAANVSNPDKQILNPDKMKAWLSKGAGDQPAVRFSAATKGKEFAGRYVMVKADNSLEVVAYGWEGLIGVNDMNTLEHAINLDEKGVGPLAVTVWTNVNANGTSASENHCESWTEATTMIYGGYGTTEAKNEQWTAAQMPATCNNANRLYCFEDP